MPQHRFPGATWRFSAALVLSSGQTGSISAESKGDMMCCTVTGQGAGVAAAASIKQSVDTSEVRIEDIQRELKRQEVRFV